MEEAKIVSTRTAERMAYIRSLRGTVKDKPKTKRKPKRKKRRPYQVVDPSVRARDLATTKIRLAMIQKATYIDGVAALPILYRIANDLGLPVMQLSIFIAMNHLKSFTTDDGKIWGYSRFTVGNSVKYLMQGGLVEVFGGKGSQKIYCVSVRGRNLFSTFQDKYQKYTLEFFDEFDKENPSRHYKPRLYDRLPHHGKTEL